LLGIEVPHGYHVIEAGTGQTLSIRAEGDTENRALVRLVGKDSPPGHGIPYFERPGIGAAGHPQSVWAESHAIGRTHGRAGLQRHVRLVESLAEVVILPAAQIPTTR